MRFPVALAVLASSAGAAADEWAIVPESSTVTMYATNQGNWFDGVFEEFTASIDFDAAKPESGTILGTVKTASIETGDSQNNAYVLQYLDVEEHPEARFESTAIESAEGYFRAHGELTLAGITNPATLDFTFATDEASPAARARFAGQMTINRFDYDIASDVDTSRTGRDVTVRIELDLER